MLLANILMIVGEGVFFYSSTRKDKKSILIVQIISMLVMSVASFLLKGYSANVMDAIGISRNILSIKGISSTFLSYLFIVLSIVLGIIFNSNGFWGLLPIVANVMQSLIILDSKATLKQLRVVSAISSLCWGMFNFAIKGYAGMFFNIANFLSFMFHAFKK